MYLSTHARIRTYPLGDTVPLVPTVGTVDYMIPIGRGGDLLKRERDDDDKGNAQDQWILFDGCFWFGIGYYHRYVLL